MLILFSKLVMVLKQDLSNTTQITWGQRTKRYKVNQNKQDYALSPQITYYYVSCLIGKKRQ